MKMVSSNLFLWLIGYVLVSRLIPEKYNKYSTLLFTSIFLFFVSPISLLILLVSSILVGIQVQKNKTTSAFLIISISFLSLIFSFFKFNSTFILDSSISEIIIPVGLSYYTFRQIHYLIEAYKGKLPSHKLIDYLNYLFFLPTFVVGPINRFPNFLKQFNRRRWDFRLFHKE